MRIHDVRKILQDENLFNEYFEKIEKSCFILGKPSPFTSDMSYKDILNNDFLKQQFTSFFETNKNGNKFNNLVQEAQEKEFMSIFGVKFETYLEHLKQSTSYKQGDISPITEFNLDISKNKVLIADTNTALQEIVKKQSIEDLEQFSGFINKQKIIEQVDSLREQYLGENFVPEMKLK